MSVCLRVLQDLQPDRDAEGIHHCSKESTFFSLHKGCRITVETQERVDLSGHECVRRLRGAEKMKK